MDATNNNKRTRANSGRQQSNRVCGQRGADASRGNQGRRPLATLALIALTSAAAVLAPDTPGNAQERAKIIATAKEACEILRIGVFYDTVEETLAANGFAVNPKGRQQGYLRKVA